MKPNASWLDGGVPSHLRPGLSPQLLNDARGTDSWKGAGSKGAAVAAPASQIVHQEQRTIALILHPRPVVGVRLLDE